MDIRTLGLCACVAVPVLVLLARRYFGGGVCRDVADLRGKVAIVTGANAGIGLETSIALMRMGAHVVFACRDKTRAAAAIDRAKRESGSDKASFIALDLASLASVRAFAEAFKRQHRHLHLLVNNAGVLTVDNKPTQDGFEMQFGVNHLGHFSLTLQLVDVLRASAPSRVVVVSSMASEDIKRGAVLNFDDIMHTKDYDASVTYFASKLANTVFANELNRRLEGTGVTANSLHPGVVSTDIANNWINSLRWWLRALLLGLFIPFALVFMKNSWQGAQTQIYLCVSPAVEGVGGRYFADCAEKKHPNPAVHDLGTAKKLWDLSERLTGVAWPL